MSVLIRRSSSAAMFSEHCSQIKHTKAMKEKLIKEVFDQTKSFEKNNRAHFRGLEIEFLNFCLTLSKKVCLQNQERSKIQIQEMNLRKSS